LGLSHDAIRHARTAYRDAVHVVNEIVSLIPSRTMQEYFMLLRDYSNKTITLIPNERVGPPIHRYVDTFMYGTPLKVVDDLSHLYLSIVHIAQRVTVNIGNDTDQVLFVMHAYLLEKYIDGSWMLVPGLYAFQRTLIGIAPNHNRNINLDIPARLGDLMPGTYRIRMEVSTRFLWDNPHEVVAVFEVV